MSFNPVKGFEFLPHVMAVRIMNAAYPVFLGEIDEAFGAAIVEGRENCKAVWTTKGRRIEVSYNSGTLIVSQSRDVDPLYQVRKAA